MIKKIISIISMVAAIVLMALPFGIAMHFSSGPGTTFPPNFYSYFDMMSPGYGNWLPMLIAVLTIITLVLIIISFKNANFKKFIIILLITCIIANVLSWLIFNSYTNISLIITLLHLITLVFEIIAGANLKLVK